MAKSTKSRGTSQNKPEKESKVEELSEVTTSEEVLEHEDVEDITETAADDQPLSDDEPDIAELSATNTTEIKKSGGFFSTMLGGVVAGVIGLGTAQYLVPEGWPFPGLDRTSQVDEEQAVLIQQLSEKLATLEAKDTSQGLNDLSANLNEKILDLNAQIAEVTAKIDAIPQSEGRGISDAGVAALNSEVSKLQSEVSQLTAAAQERENKENAAARLMSSQIAMTGIATALDSGSSLAEYLDVLRGDGVSIPEDLAKSAAGVMTLNDLQIEFPEAARNALNAAREEGADSSGGIGDFLRSQLGARSLQPREGSDSDAILSRAEAALNDRLLNDTLAELDGLSDAAKTAMGDWLSNAQARQTAVSAFDALSATTNTH